MTVYSGYAWQQGNRRYLARNPTCVDCGRPATQRDHVPPRRLLIAVGIHDPDADQWLQPRCTKCHSKKTRIVDEPLMRRYANGESAQTLCEEIMDSACRVG